MRRKNKKFIFERANLNYLKNINRMRIGENRNLVKGIRMNRNERVEDFDKNTLSKIFKNVKKYDLGKYPDQQEIYKEVSKFINIKEKNILLSSGIDGSIKSILEILTKPGDNVTVLHPTYAMYEIYSSLFKLKLTKIGYDKTSLKLDKRGLINKIKKGPKILFIPNPNQPIEDNLSFKDLEKICKLCKKFKVLLVIDEAYHMYGSDTVASLIKKYKNIIILRTFSKSFGIPSIRLGYIISSEKIISLLNKFRLSYESNFLSNKVVIYFIKNKKKIYNYIYKVKKGRDYFKLKMKKLNFDVIGGKSNFLLVNFKSKIVAEKIYYGLLKKHTYVKGNYKPPLDKCLLFTCGSIKIMQKVYKQIYRIIN